MEMAIKTGNIPAHLELFLRIFGLVDIVQNPNGKRDQLLIGSWTLFWLLLNVQSLVYFFVKLALPALKQVFLENVKGVRSQMSSLAAFLAHTTPAAAGLICHSILILMLRGSFHRLEGLVQIDPNRPEFRKWSKIVILCILLSVR